MKTLKYSLLFFALISGAQTSLAQRAGAKSENQINLSVNVFQKKETDSKATFRTGMIQNDDEALQLINALQSSDPNFKKWMTLNDPVKNSNSAVIFVQHQFNPKQLLRKDDDSDRAKICSEYNKLRKDSLSTAACLKNLDASCFSKPGEPSGDQLDYIVFLKSKLDSISVKMEAAKEEYSSSLGKFIEMDPIVSYNYHFENKKHSDYLLDTKEIYVILIGGKTDVAASSLGMKRVDTRFQTDSKSAAMMGLSYLTGDPTVLTKITETNSMVIFDFIEKDSLKSNLPEPEPCTLKLVPAKISVTLLHIDRKQIITPGELTITPLGKTAITLLLHARQYMGVQAGIQGGKLDLRNYTFVSDTLNVSIPFEKTVYDAMPFVFLQLYPGRDIDRLYPFRIKDLKWIDLRNRFGVYGAIRLSKKPFSTMSAGISFALGPNVNLHTGFWFSRTLDVVTNYYVGPLQNEARLDEFAPASYPKYFTIGISVSPGIYKDWFVK